MKLGRSKGSGPCEAYLESTWAILFHRPYQHLPLQALASLYVRQVDLVEAPQTATPGLITLIPEGLVLLMSVTFAVAAVKLARRDTLVQQMSATESLGSVDTICVDKTGTLTSGELELIAVEVADGGDPDAARKALARSSSCRRASGVGASASAS